MGMLITEIRTIPEKYLMEKNRFFNLIQIEADEKTAEDEDGYEYKVLCGMINENTFESWWNQQENINPTEENKKEYLARAKAGRLCYIQTDID
jgi:hypothetical protein